MLSSFIKKLLFVRQFSMVDGSIKVLGKHQIMLPLDVVYKLEVANATSIHDHIKQTVKKDLQDYAKVLGAKEQGMMMTLFNVFESFGLGKIEMVKMDYKKGSGVVRVHNPPMNGNIRETKITSAVLSGLFSFLLKKDLTANTTENKVKTYQEYIIS